MNSHTNLLVATTVRAAGLTLGTRDVQVLLLMGHSECDIHTVDWERKVSFRMGGPGKCHDSVPLWTT